MLAWANVHGSSVVLNAALLSHSDMKPPCVLLTLASGPSRPSRKCGPNMAVQAKVLAVRTSVIYFMPGVRSVIDDHDRVIVAFVFFHG